MKSEKSIKLELLMNNEDIPSLFTQVQNKHISLPKTAVFRPPIRIPSDSNEAEITSAANFVTESTIKGTAMGPALGISAAALIYQKTEVASQVQSSIDHAVWLNNLIKPTGPDTQTFIEKISSLLTVDFASKVGLSMIFPFVGAFVGPFVGAAVGNVVGRIISGIGSLFNRQRGSITRSQIGAIHSDVDSIWAELVKNKYINQKGNIQSKFLKLKVSTELQLSPQFKDHQEEIFKLLQKTNQEYVAKEKAVKRIRFAPPPAKTTGFIGAFSGVISGAFQGGSYGAAFGPWGIAVGAVVGAVACGIAGFLGGFLGGLCVKGLTRLFNRQPSIMVHASQLPSAIKQDSKIMNQLFKNPKSEELILKYDADKTLVKLRALFQENKIDRNTAGVLWMQVQKGMQENEKKKIEKAALKKPNIKQAADIHKTTDTKTQNSIPVQSMGLRTALVSAK